MDGSAIVVSPTFYDQRLVHKEFIESFFDQAICALHDLGRVALTFNGSPGLTLASFGPGRIS
jgi:hypothetical protein